MHNKNSEYSIDPSFIGTDFNSATTKYVKKRRNNVWDK